MTSRVVHLNAWKKNVSRDDKGRPTKGLTNVITYVRGVAGNMLRYNELADRMEYQGEAIKNSDFSTIQLLMEVHGLVPSDRDLTRAVEAVAVENSYHPIREYLESLQPWDKVNRLATMFPKFFASPDTPYEQAIGVRYMIASVARAYDPGCKMDNMLILEGDQGTYKSTALRVLFTPEYFTEMVGVLKDTRRFIEQIMGKWCVEFAEFTSLNEAGVDLVKALTAVQIDRTTRNYSRVGATEHPRQCVMAATINPIEGCGYLKDPTGGRRFWPVRCGMINIKQLVLFRDRLWAEALHRYREGERWHLTESEFTLASIEQESRKDVDIWQDMLEEALDKTQKYASHEILFKNMGIDMVRQGQAEKNRLAISMKKIGWSNIPDKRDGKSVRLWRYQSPDTVL